MSGFGDFIVYVDESGDHGLSSINPDYPIFVLAFCVFDKRDYLEQVVPKVQELKFRYFGHDMVILHEAEIRKARPPFEFLLNPKLRAPFMEELTGLIRQVPFTIVATAIRKEPFRHRKGVDHNPYHIAMEYGLERVFLELQAKGQRRKQTHVVFERRGRQEDEALELEFRRIMDRTRMEGMGETLDMVMADKQVNSAGLQLADMVARPIGRHILKPDQPNRAFDILEPKIRRGTNGEIRGYGLKCYP